MYRVIQGYTVYIRGDVYMYRVSVYQLLNLMHRSSQYTLNLCSHLILLQIRSRTLHLLAIYILEIKSGPAGLDKDQQ